MAQYLLALNCGSSSIKGRLYQIPETARGELQQIVKVSVSNITTDHLKTQYKWSDGRGKDIDEEGGSNAQHSELVTQLIKRLNNGGVESRDIKYVVHRIVHGGEHKKGIRVSKGHTEGLAEMDKLSAFAPLHNHHAVLAVKACLEALPEHESLLVFDTLFHQTIPRETYAYALPSSSSAPMPLRKYGFHGLSYASIVRSMARHLNKPEKEMNIVVAHLGSGASACCIRGGESIDTSMGLTPLEGLLGGTRSGTIDPTAIFHHTPDAAEDAGLEGMKVTKAEMILNKQSGLKALAGTTDFGMLIQRIEDPDRCSKDEAETAALAYAVYLDRLLGYLSQYLFKLLAEIPIEDVDGIVFSGGIGEKASKLRGDALKRFEWLGCKPSEAAGEQEVECITEEDSRLKAWVVQTDEEGWCATLAREDFGF